MVEKLFSFSKFPGSDNQVGSVIFLISVIVLAGSYGILAGHFDLWPSQVFKRAYHALIVLTGERDDRPQEWRDFWVDEVRRDLSGVTRHEPARSSPGYTAFSSIHKAGVFLVDMDGREVHRWVLNRESLETHLGLKSNRLVELAWIDRMKLLPNGSLWALVMTYDTISNSTGLVRLSRDSEVEWVYRANVHHDFDIAQNGIVFVLTYGMGNIDRNVSEHLSGRTVFDYVDVVAPDGTLIKRISILNCILNSKYRQWLTREEIVASSQVNDVLHTNAVRLVNHHDWRLVPNNGHTHALVSIRDLHLIGLIDLDEERLIEAWRGNWLLQHDPDLLSDGTIMLFDNWGGVGGKSRSRVIRFDPASGATLWQWPSTQSRDHLDSIFRGSQQLLPNGNTLITESHGGRILEVTSGGEVVWEYYSPFRQGENREYVPILRWAERIQAPWLEN